MGVGSQLHTPTSLPAEKKPDFIGGWLGPRAGLDGCGKYLPHRDSIPGPSIPYRVAILTELSRTTELKMYATKTNPEAGNDLQSFNKSFA
jgi:hypothetical protein